MTDHDSSQANTARILAGVALAGWGASLLLPGFWVAGSDPDRLWGGAAILGMGTLFGWATLGGWAVYANFFFLYMVAKAYGGRGAPIAIGLTILLGASVFLFEGVIHPGLGRTIPVASWGWGAILWGASLLTGVIASVYAATPSDRSPNKGFIVGLAILSATTFGVIGLIGYSQWGRANAQDRVLLLPPLAAFTVSDICDAPLVNVPAALVPADERIVVEIDSALMGSDKYLPDMALPLHGRVLRQDGIDYAVYKGIPGLPGQLITFVQIPKADYEFSLKAERANRGAVLRLRGPSGRVLYEQPLAIRWSGNRASYCPAIAGPGNSGMQVVGDMLKKLGGAPVDSSPQPVHLTAERVEEYCVAEQFSPRDAGSGVRSCGMAVFSGFPVRRPTISCAAMGSVLGATRAWCV